MNMNKIVSKLPVGFADEAQALDNTALERCVLDATQALAEVDREIAEHEQLKAAKAVVRDLMGPFQDARKAQRAKIAYCLHLIEERGIMRGVGAASASAEAVTVEIRTPGSAPVKTTLAGLERAARAVESRSAHTGAEGLAAGSAGVVRS